MGKLDGRVVIVTGAARGQGEQEARLFRQEGAEGQHQAHLAATGELEHGPAVRLPAQVRLGRDPDDQVAVEVARAGDGELHGRPHDLALGLRAGPEPDVGTGLAEVVEGLGVDLGELLGAEGRRQVAGRRRRRLGGVVPAAERGDEDRPTQARGQRVDGERVHRLLGVFLASLTRGPGPAVMRRPGLGRLSGY